MLEKEMDANAENLKSIVAQGHEMARAGHFDSAAILRAVQEFDKRFNMLQEPMASRRRKLEDSLRWHQFNFDADSELQWIGEHMPAATATDCGKNLIDAQNLNAKHKVGDPASVVNTRSHNKHWVVISRDVCLDSLRRSSTWR